MKRILQIFYYLLITSGFTYFILRSFISTISPDESFSRDILGLPLLEPGLEVSSSIWLQSMLGVAIPYVLIGAGYLIHKLISSPK